MRTLLTLATLLVGLAFVFWAPTAKADCPHGAKFIHPHCDGVAPGATLGDLSCTIDQIAKFDGIDWVCAEDNSGFVVRDGSGNFVGSVIIMGSLVARISFRGDPGVTPFFETHPLIALQVTPEGFQFAGINSPSRNTILFHGLDCTGDPFVPSGKFDEESIFDLPSAPVLEYDDCLAPATLYVPLGANAVDEPFILNSFLRRGIDTDVTCTNANGTESLATPVLAIELDACPPFSLSE